MNMQGQVPDRYNPPGSMPNYNTSIGQNSSFPQLTGEGLVNLSGALHITQHSPLCITCRSAFSDTTQFNQHARYTSHRSYGCTCGTTFSRVDALSRHLRNLDIQCMLCIGDTGARSPATDDQLRRHLASEHRINDSMMGTLIPIARGGTNGSVGTLATGFGTSSLGYGGTISGGNGTDGFGAISFSTGGFVSAGAGMGSFDTGSFGIYRTAAGDADGLSYSDAVPVSTSGFSPSNLGASVLYHNLGGSSATNAPSAGSFGTSGFGISSAVNYGTVGFTAVDSTNGGQIGPQAYATALQFQGNTQPLNDAEFYPHGNDPQPGMWPY
ncbi:hypothetical protein F5Y04DRAFT_277448 [Hypomontagnella monticulosa]|nr:hypothetical protein F5Y04DRAFT_277448 [Hypomontagnella monticulosa]